MLSSVYIKLHECHYLFIFFVIWHIFIIVQANAIAICVRDNVSNVLEITHKNNIYLSHLTANIGYSSVMYYSYSYYYYTYSTNISIN